MCSAEQRLLQIIDNAMAEAHARSGQALHCAKGCSGCCIGPFPITSMDSARLRRGLHTLPREIAATIANRAGEACRNMDAHYPGDACSGHLDEQRSDELFHNPRFTGIPCPVLDLETGACQLYEFRPVACRTYGPAITLEGRPMPHCRLNYRHLPADQVEACRVTVDPGETGAEACAEFEAKGGRLIQTTVAFALR